MSTSTRSAGPVDNSDSVVVSSPSDVKVAVRIRMEGEYSSGLAAVISRNVVAPEDRGAGSVITYKRPRIALVEGLVVRTTENVPDGLAASIGRQWYKAVMEVYSKTVWAKVGVVAAANL